MKKNTVFIFLALFAMMASIVSCSSPESDGKKVGKKINKCYIDNITERIEKVNKFISTFNPSDYNSRIEAKKVLSDIDSLASVELARDLEDVNKAISDKRKKYITNAEKIQQFDFAKSAIVDEAESDIITLSKQYAELMDEAYELIITIPVAKPTEQRIPADLAGKTIVEPTHELFRSRFNIENSEMVRDVTVLNTEESNGQVFYLVELKLNDGINDYVAKAKLTYELADNDDWQIQYIESEYLDIVPTGNFNSCISIKKNNGWLYEEYIFSNNCDVSLVVEGKGVRYHDWENFSVLVPGNSTTRISNYSDIKVTRIERP